MNGISLIDLCKTYNIDDKNIKALDKINLTLDPQKRNILIGPSGCGKSTLIKAIGGLLEIDSGKIIRNDIKTSIVFQNPRLLPWLNVKENILFSNQNENLCKKWIKIIGLEGFENAYPSQLSGGMKQRVGIAQALLNNPKILILDEPTAGLDPKERVRFRNLLSEYAGDKIVILSTHIVSDIEAIADEVLLMKKGKFILQGTVPELIHKANGKVWELSASPQEARQWQTKTTVANLRHEGKEIILRIISDNMPSERAVPCEATLEDLYLFYFPTEEGVK